MQFRIFQRKGLKPAINYLENTGKISLERHLLQTMQRLYSFDLCSKAVMCY